MIRADNVTVRLAGRPVLSQVGLAVRPGTLTVLAGPNGAGKSTLLKLLTGEMEPTAGSVTLDGKPLRDIGPATLATRRAVLPQASELAFPFTVGEVVRLGVEAGGRRASAEAIHAALARVELQGFAGRFYGELSGGEQQRVHLARVLAQTGQAVADRTPRYLFLDEPVSSLDIRHQIAVLAIAREFARAGGGVLAVLHDLNLAAGFADRLVLLAKGRVAGDGSPSSVITDDSITRVFGVCLRVGALPPSSIPFILPQTAALP